MIHNLTPHPIRIFDSAIPDTFDYLPGEDDFDAALVVDEFPPSSTHKVAHLSEMPLDRFDVGGTTVETVSYGLLEYVPPQMADTYYIVPLATALACKRSDFLVPYHLVRNLEGTVVGCKMLARPV